MAVRFTRLLTHNELFVGLEGLCDKIRVDIKKGLTGSDLPERREYFGTNEAKKPVAEGFFAKLWDAL